MSMVFSSAGVFGKVYQQSKNLAMVAREDTYAVHRRPSLASSVNFIQDDVESLVVVKKKITCFSLVKKLWSIRCLLLIFFVFFISAVGLGIWLIGYLSAARSVDNLTYIAQSYLSSDVSHFTAGFTERAPIVVNLIASEIQWINYNEKNVSSNFTANQPRLLSILDRYMQKYPDITGLYLGNENQDTLIVQRAASSLVAAVKEGLALVSYLYDQKTTRITGKGSITSPVYDPRSRPWYSYAKKAASTTWVPLYFQVTTPVILALAVSTPFFSPNGTILGVVSVNFDTNSMSKFLAKQQKGDIFILDTDAQIVATSVGNATVPSGSTLARVAGVNHTSAIVQETSKLIMNTFGTISKVPNATNLLYVDSSGISRAVDIKAFRDTYGLNWLIVDVLNYSELIYSVNQSTMISIIISVLAIVISVVVSLVFGIVITRPLKALSSEMNEIANMNLTPNSTMTFKLDEFNEIADSMSQMKQGLTNFAKFVPQDVVRSMLVRNEVVKLGVTQRVITIMFLDIEGFTTISETVSPAQLIKILSKFFTTMSSVILENAGTIDKFIGDCIMAFWNAPAYVDDHELAALDSVAEMYKKLDMLRQRWTEKGFPNVNFRIGINTARCLVGNIGAPDRLNYTALGDGVNIGARLEGANKIYGTKTLIGEQTYEKVKSKYLCRWVDFISVKGKSIPLDVYEYICPIADATSQQIQLCTQHEKARDLLKESRFDAVHDLCSVILLEDSKDMPALLLKQRMEQKHRSISYMLLDK